MSESYVAMTAIWHESKYPDATMVDVGLKLAEECGEVCQCIDRIKYGRQTSTARLMEEIGDAGIVLEVLAQRYCGRPLADLISERFQTVRLR